jgi:hypothetical protein
VVPDGERPNELVDRAYQVGGAALAAAPAPAGERRTAIRAVGIVQIVLGGLCGLLALLLAATVERRNDGSAIACAVPAINLLVAGIGVVKLASWGRRATLISAIVWLVLLAGFGAIVLLGPDSGPGDTSWEEAKVGAVPMLVGWAAMPILLIVFFTRRRVRAAFQRPAA